MKTYDDSFEQMLAEIIEEIAATVLSKDLTMREHVGYLEWSIKPFDIYPTMGYTVGR